MLSEEGHDGRVAIFAGNGLGSRAPLVLRGDVQSRERQQEADDVEVPIVRGDVDRGPIVRVVIVYAYHRYLKYE